MSQLSSCAREGGVGVITEDPRGYVFDEARLRTTPMTEMIIEQVKRPRPRRASSGGSGPNFC